MVRPLWHLRQTDLPEPRPAPQSRRQNATSFAVRRFSGTSAISLSFSCRMTSNNPRDGRPAAFSLFQPPMGSTLPRRQISPVMAESPRTAILLRALARAVAMVMPAGTRHSSQRRLGTRHALNVAGYCRSRSGAGRGGTRASRCRTLPLARNSLHHARRSGLKLSSTVDYSRFRAGWSLRLRQAQPVNQADFARPECRAI